MASKALAGEYVAAIAISSYSSIKDQQMPWPPSIVLTSVAFAILGMVEIFDERLAAVLGAGFLLANVVRIYQTGQPFTGGAPKNQHDGTGLITNAFGPGTTGITKDSNGKIVNLDAPVGILSWGNTTKSVDG